MAIEIPNVLTGAFADAQAALALVESGAKDRDAAEAALLRAQQEESAKAAAYEAALQSLAAKKQALLVLIDHYLQPAK